MSVSRHSDQNHHNTTPQRITFQALRLPRADGNPARDPCPLRRLPPPRPSKRFRRSSNPTISPHSILFHLSNRAPPAVEQHVHGGCREIFLPIDGRELSIREIVPATVLLVQRQRRVVTPVQHAVVAHHTPEVVDDLVLVANLVSRCPGKVVLAYLGGPLTVAAALRVLLAAIRGVEGRSPGPLVGSTPLRVHHDPVIHRRVLAAASAFDPGPACARVLGLLRPPAAARS